MGALYLTDLADVLPAAGRPGASRSTAGRPGPRLRRLPTATAANPITCHRPPHRLAALARTAGPTSSTARSTTTTPRCATCTCPATAPSTSAPPAPRTRNGSGQDPCGHIADDTMNAARDRRSKPATTAPGRRWPDEQLDAYTCLCAALVRRLRHPDRTHPRPLANMRPAARSTRPGPTATPPARRRGTWTTSAPTGHRPARPRARTRTGGRHDEPGPDHLRRRRHHPRRHRRRRLRPARQDVRSPATTPKP